MATDALQSALNSFIGELEQLKISLDQRPPVLLINEIINEIICTHADAYRCITSRVWRDCVAARACVCARARESHIHFNSDWEGVVGWSGYCNKTHKWLEIITIYIYFFVVVGGVYVFVSPWLHYIKIHATYVKMRIRTYEKKKNWELTGAKHSVLIKPTVSAFVGWLFLVLVPNTKRTFSLNRNIIWYNVSFSLLLHAFGICIIKNRANEQRRMSICLWIWHKNVSYYLFLFLLSEK